MSSFTSADLKLGGRLIAACDAIGQGHLRRAAGIFNEIADDLNVEAEATTGLMAPDHEATPQDLERSVPCEDDWSSPMPEKPKPPVQQASSADLQMCARNVHAYGPPDMSRGGWRTCSVCGSVNVAPPGGGPVDMGARQ